MAQKNGHEFWEPEGSDGALLKPVEVLHVTQRE